MVPSPPASGRWAAWHAIRDSRKVWILSIFTIAIAILLVAVISDLVPAERLRAAFTATVQKLIENLHWLVPAAFGAAIVWHEGRLRLRLHEKALELFQQATDLSQRRFDKEMELSQKRLEADQADREERRKLFMEESSAIRDMSEPLSKMISEKLSENTRWASEAMERARLGAHGQTVFGERIGHFAEEKKYLAENFTPMLLTRCEKLSETHDRIFLLIDSGTTLHPFFSHLGESVVKSHDNHEDWADKIEIVTNNLPGVEALIDTGRRNPRNRFSLLDVRCQLLPGEPLPVYAAVTGPQTEEAVRALKNNAKNSYFIALITGNWISIRHKGLRCPIPLARGKGHRGFKQSLIDCAHETFVIAPLGKIWVRADLAHINASLGLSGNPHHRDLDKQPYDEVSIDADEKAAHVKLVSTSRGPDRVLSGLYHHLEIALQLDSKDDDEHLDFATAEEPNHVLLGGFDEKLPKDWWLELRDEFPHKAEQRHARQHDFFVPSQPPASRQRA